MPKEHKISWTNKTWNPIRGCSRVSSGCKNCYAELMAARFSDPGPFAGFAERKYTFKTGGSKSNWEPHWTGKVELIESKLDEPLHWKRPCLVFVNSMSDLWHEKLAWLLDIAKVYAVMYQADWHTYQVLTKRPEIRLEALKDPFFWEAVSKYAGKPCRSGAKHIWEGLSVEDQPTADERIVKLLKTPAAVRFVSYEPALANVEWQPEWISARCPECRNWVKRGWTDCPMPDCDGRPQFNGLDWVIIGGESGPQARPCRLSWARETIRACRSAGVPCFVKQLGSRPVGETDDLPFLTGMKDRKGGDWAEWPKDLKVREFPPKI